MSENSGSQNWVGQYIRACSMSWTSLSKPMLKCDYTSIMLLEHYSHQMQVKTGEGRTL